MQDRLTQVVKEYLREQGLDLIELKMTARKNGMSMRLLIDRPGNVTIQDCVTVHKELRWLLESDGLVQGRLNLEVSSPGPRRRLRVPQDLKRFTGEPVRLVLHEPVDGLYVVNGRLVQVDTDRIVVLDETQEIVVPMANIKRANLWR